MRARSIAGIVVATIVLLAPAARAGGSWFEVTVDGRDRPGRLDWAPVGAAVTMEARFCDGQRPPPGGTRWFATLRAASGRGGVALGEVSTKQVDGAPCAYEASVRFAVPDVAHGPYFVDVCDAGCTTGVGDLVGGYLVVADSAREAGLHVLVTRLDEALVRLRVRAETAEPSEVAVIRERLDTTRDELVTALDALDLVTSQKDVALAQAETARAAAAQARRDAADWRHTSYLLVVLGLVTIAVALVRRRHTVRVRIPDSPEELVAPSDDRADRSHP